MQPSERDSLSGDRIVRNKSRRRKKGPSDGHSHSGNGIGRDKSGRGKNMIERERPTF